MSEKELKAAIKAVGMMLDDGPPDGRLPAWVFAEAIEKLTVAICISDAEAHILYANAAFTQLTGYSLADVLGRNASILSDQSTPPQVYTQMWERLRCQEAWTGLLVNRRKQGTVYIAELSIVPLLDQDGNTTHYLGLHRDVTAVHQLEQQVLNQKALIESIVDASPVLIALLDETGKVVRHNPAYRKLAGEIRGREPATELLLALRQSLGDAFYRDRHSAQGFDSKEVSFEFGGGEATRWFSCSGAWLPARDDSAGALFRPVNQTYLLLMATEITNLKRQQEAIAMNAMRALMAEQDRVRGMRETLEGAIFQMQRPMNLIAAAHDILERRGETHGELLLALRQALAAGREALAKLQNSMPEVPPEAVAPVNINQLIREVLGLSTQRMLALGIVVEWHPAPVLPAVPAREDRLRCLFKQLVDNALDAMESHRSNPRELRIATWAEEGAVVITVEDTGPGIPDALRLKIFEPFFTSKGRSDRTGLGLALVQDVINEHRGTINIDPDYNQGCRFRVLLPLIHEESAA